MKTKWELNHLGFVVKDMDRAMQYYTSLGIAEIGPEKIMEAFDGTKIKVRLVEIGSLMLEFFEPPEGAGVSGKYLKERGEGINHMAFTVKDLDHEIDKLKRAGLKHMFRGQDEDFGKIAYFDTGEIAGIVTELVEPF